MGHLKLLTVYNAEVVSKQEKSEGGREGKTHSSHATIISICEAQFRISPFSFPDIFKKKAWYVR